MEVQVPEAVVLEEGTLQEKVAPAARVDPFNHA